MPNAISKRLLEVVESLPLSDGMRILEIGCGPGVAAREVSRRIGSGYVLAIDRSEKAIRQAIEGSQSEVRSGRLAFRHVAVEDFQLGAKETKFDIAFAIRVGALDGRHPKLERRAFENIARALKPGGRLFIDGGNPLKEISLDDYR